MCDIRLNDNIKCISGINLEGQSLIRRSRRVWDPPKNGPIAPMIVGASFIKKYLTSINVFSDIILNHRRI